MTKLDWFGHWFYASLFFGMILLHAKDFRGWIFRLAGEVGWIGIGLVIGMSSVWLWGFAFLVVDVLGYFKWQKEQEELAAFEREQEEWLGSAGAALAAVETDLGFEYVKDIVNGENKTSISKSQRPRVAKERSKADNRKVRPTRGRRSIEANGKRRSRLNDEPSRKKKISRKSGVQKNGSRSRTRSTRSSKA